MITTQTKKNDPKVTFTVGQHFAAEVIQEFYKDFVKGNKKPKKSKHSTSPNPTSTSTTKKRPRSDSATRSDLTPSEQEKLNSLGDFLESCGGQASLVASWDCSEKFRGAGGYSADGKSSKNSDTYFYDEGGAQFRSKTEVSERWIPTTKLN